MAAEFTPADFAQKFSDIAGKRGMFVGGELRRGPDLAWTDLAEAQMRRQPRCAVAIRSIAIAAVACDVLEETLEMFLRRGFARCPCLAQSAGPIGRRGFELPVSE